MRIELSGGLAIVSLDDRNWQIIRTRVREKGKHAGESYEEGLGYFPSLAVAAKRTLDLVVGDMEVKDLRAVIASVELAEANIVRACWTIYNASKESAA
jgi:hypothetical protein